MHSTDFTLLHSTVIVKSNLLRQLEDFSEALSLPLPVGPLDEQGVVLFHGEGPDFYPGALMVDEDVPAGGDAAAAVFLKEGGAQGPLLARDGAF